MKKNYKNVYKNGFMRRFKNVTLNFSFCNKLHNS